MIYALSPKQNLRVGYSQTVSRPDFRELARFGFLNVVGGLQTIGNPELVQTDISNYDFRWEYFPSGNQLVAASFFYKKFENPIEQTMIAAVALLRTFSNATAADNYGFELEFRRGMDFVSPKLREFAVASNFTVVNSSIDLTNVSDTVVLTSLARPMQGQSRYVANVIAEWARPKARSTARFYVNYFSEPHHGRRRIRASRRGPGRARPRWTSSTNSPSGATTAGSCASPARTSTTPTGGSLRAARSSSDTGKAARSAWARASDSSSGGAGRFPRAAHGLRASLSRGRSWPESRPLRRLRGLSGAPERSDRLQFTHGLRRIGHR